MLPYFHEFITDSEGLKSWVPVLGIEQFLKDSNEKILGFSQYRVFLYTFLIFVFATIGWAGWYSRSKEKYYGNALGLVMFSGLYHIILILFNLRRTFLNEAQTKSAVLVLLLITLGYLSYRKHLFTKRKTLVWLLLSTLAFLPFLHDVLTERSGPTWSWIPDLGIENLLTDSEGMVRGLRSYRLLLYLFGIYLFSHLGWLGWFMDSIGSRIRAFLLFPVAISLYQVILIVMSWRETEFNSPSVYLYITIGIAIALAINFFYNNKVAPKGDIAINKE